MASINVKVLVGDQSKTFRFPLESYVSDAIREVREKIVSGSTGASDHGLFQPETGEIKPRWLKNNRTLKYYGITNGSELVYKKKHRALKVHLLDESTRTCLIDSTKNVKKIVIAIGERLGLKNADEYALRKLDAPEDAWLDEDKALHEVNVKDDEALLFAKRFFSADYNIDKDDPVQLHLIYVQAAHSIVNGKYDPLQREEAIYLAAHQCQILYGNVDAQRLKSSGLELAKLLPVSWRKDKKIEKDIIKEYTNITGTTEINAKYRYLQLVRSLKSYGVTFFECTYKPPRKKKPTKVFLGVTKDKAIFYDENRVQLKEWGFDQMKSWTATSSTFSLDLGDFEDDVFVFHTSEGDAISQLINGYVDIIMKSYVDTSRSDIYDKADTANVSDKAISSGSTYYSMSQSMTPGQGGQSMNVHGMNISHIAPSVSQSGSSQSYSVDFVGYAQGESIIQAYPESQKLLVFDVDSALKATQVLSGEMDRGLLGYNASTQLSGDQWRKQLGTYQDNLAKNIEDLLAQARMDSSQYDKNQIDMISKHLHQNMMGMAIAAKNIASLEDDIPLLTTAQSVAESLSRLLKSVHEDDLTQLSQAEAALNDALLALQHAREQHYTDRGSEALLSALTDRVKVLLEEMIRLATEGSERLDPAAREAFMAQIHEAIFNKDFTLSGLKALITVAVDDDALKRIVNAIHRLRDIAGEIDSNAQKANIGQDYLDSLNNANQRIGDILKTLLASTLGAEPRGAEGQLDLHTPNTTLVASLTEIRKNVNTPKELVVPTKQCIESSNEILTTTKKLADTSNDDTKERLMRATRNMGYTLQMLLDSVRVVYKNPSDTKSKEQILDATNRIEVYAQDMIADAGITAALTNLRYYSKLTTALTTSLVGQIESVLPTVTDERVQNEWTSMSENIQKSLDNLVDSIKEASRSPADMITQTALMEEARRVIPLLNNYFDSIQHNDVYIGDKEKLEMVSKQLKSTRKVTDELEKICMIVADIGGQTQIDEAMTDFDAMNVELDAYDFSSSNGLLTVNHSLDRDATQRTLVQCAKQLLDDVTQLTEAANSGSQIAQVIKKSSESSDALIQAVYVLASSIVDRATQQRIIRAAKLVIHDVIYLVGSTRVLNTDTENPVKKDTVDKDFKQTKGSIASLIASSKGLNASECDEAVKQIRVAINLLSYDTPTHITFKQASESLSSISKALRAALVQLVGIAKTNPQGIGSSAKITASTTIQLLQATTIAASSSVESATKETLVEHGKLLGEKMIHLIVSTKNTAASRDADTMTKLDEASQDVVSAIQALLNALGAGGSQEYEEAIRIFMTAIQKADRTQDATESKSRDVIMEEFQNNAYSLLSLVGKIAAACRVSITKLGSYAKVSALSFDALINASLANHGSERDIFQTILTAGKTVGVSAIQYMRDSMSVLNHPDNADISNQFNTSSKSYTDAISGFIQAYSVLNPGYQECILLEETLLTVDAELDAAQIAMSTGGINRTLDDKHETIQEALIELCKDIGDDLSRLGNAAKDIHEQSLVDSAKIANVHASNLANATIQLVISSSTVDEKKRIFSHVKDLVQAYIPFVRDVKICNPNDKALMEKVDNSSSIASAALSKILGILQSTIVLQREIDRLIEETKSQISLLPNKIQVENKYNEYRSKAERLLSKDFTEQIQKISSLQEENLGSISLLVGKLREQLPKIVSNTRGTISSTKDDAASQEILTCAKDLMNQFLKHLEHTKLLSRDPKNPVHIQNQRSSHPLVMTAISKVLEALKKGALGEILCERAVEMINGAIGRITTSSIFAQAGQLEPEKELSSVSLTSLQQNVIDSVNKVVIVGQKVEDSTSEGQEILGERAMELAEIVVQISDNCISMASKLNDSNLQENLLGSAKFLAIRAHQFILAGKDLESSPDASNQEVFDTAKSALQEAVNDLVTVAGNALSESVGEKHLEKAIRQIQRLMKDTPGYDSGTPQDVIKAARECTTAVTKLVFAATQDEIIASAKAAYNSTESLLNSVKTASKLSPDPKVSEHLIQSSLQYAQSMCSLLETAKLNRQEPTTQNKLEDASSETTSAIQNIVLALQSLPDASDLSLDEVSDLELQASEELAACAKIIEMALASIGKFKPGQNIGDQDILTDEVINNAIITASMAIVQATGNLINGATTAQKERSEKMKGPGGKQFKNDPTWANGVIAATKAVASAVNQLVKANSTIGEGKVNQELLIASARAVASSTAQLVTASRAKADPNSPSQKKLAESARMVTNATTRLVEAAQKASQISQQTSDESYEFNEYLGMSKEKFEQQIRILKLEAEIEREKRRMANMKGKQ